jgi:peptide deformylase
MAILVVARMGNPVLRQVAAAVSPERLASPEFQRLCDDLLDSMGWHDGVGLSGPQVHVGERVVVVDIDGELGPLFLINPVVTPATEETRVAYEGCLSLPGLRGQVRRAAAVRVEAIQRDGTAISFEAHEWAARVVQHECDHLDGILYIDRATPGSMTYLEEFRRFGAPIPGDDAEDDEDDGPPDGESPPDEG